MVKKSAVYSKLNLRELKKNWFQYLSMIAIVALAVTLFCGFVSNTDVLRKRVDTLYEECNLCDLYVQVSGLDEEDRAYFDGLENAEYRFYSDGVINGHTAKIYMGDTQISRPAVTQGEAGVLIDETVAKNNEYALGDEITLKLSSINMETKFKITGFMRFAEISNIYSTYPVYLSVDAVNRKIEELLGPAASYIDIEKYYNQVLVRTSDAEALRGEIENYFASRGEESHLIYVFDRGSMESVVMLDNEVSQSLSMITVFPVIFLVVSILVILTTISQLILRERTNIGTMKALGVSNFKIMMHYSLFGMLVCLIGGGMGVVLGPAIIPNVMSIKYGIIYNLPEVSTFVINVGWSIFSIALICILAAGISALVLKDVIKEKPAECMRPASPKLAFGKEKNNG